MSQYTLARPGPKQYTLNRTTNQIEVTVMQRVMQVDMVRSVVVVVTGDGPAPVEVKSNHTHAQVLPASTWVIDHELGYNPAGILVFDSAGGQWLPNVTYSSLTRVILNFGSASFAGKAYLS